MICFFNLHVKLKESVFKQNLSHKFGLETVAFLRGLNQSQTLIREPCVLLGPPQ